MKIIIDPAFAWWPEIHQTIHCRCGVSFRGRTKFTYVDGQPAKIVDRECPGCGPDLDVRMTESDPEIWTIGG